LFLFFATNFIIRNLVVWRVPKSLARPTWGSKYVELWKVGTWGPFPTSNTRRGVEGHARSPGIRLRRGTSIISLESASKTNHKRVSSHSGTPLGVGTSHMHLDSLDSPRPGLGGSHHLPPYSIFYDFLPHLHPNGSFSRDSQSGVPKLFRFGLLGLWTLITPRPKLRLKRGLNQSCSSLRELSNAMSHSFSRCREEVDSRLLVVESQTASLTPGRSFAHNLGCKCPNGTCEAILGIYISRPFHWYKEKLNARCFGSWTRALNFRESRRTLTSHFWGCEFHLHTYPKVGLRHRL